MVSFEQQRFLTCAAAGTSAICIAPPPMIAPPQVQAQSLARAIRTDIGFSLFSRCRCKAPPAHTRIRLPLAPKGQSFVNGAIALTAFGCPTAGIAGRNQPKRPILSHNSTKLPAISLAMVNGRRRRTSTHAGRRRGGIAFAPTWVQPRFMGRWLSLRCLYRDRRLVIGAAHSLVRHSGGKATRKDARAPHADQDCRCWR